MALKNIHSLTSTVIVSAITSIVFAGATLFIYFQVIAPKLVNVADKKPASGSSTAVFQADLAAKYEGVINGFLDKIRKGETEAVYKETSPSFQKLTSFDDFKKLVSGYVSAKSLPASACSVTEYSDPYVTTITGLPDQYTLIITKCEVTEKEGIKGFNVELAEDKGMLKISYISAYQGPVIHQK